MGYRCEGLKQTQAGCLKLSCDGCLRMRRGISFHFCRRLLRVSFASPHYILLRCTVTFGSCCTAIYTPGWAPSDREIVIGCGIFCSVGVWRTMLRKPRLPTVGRRSHQPSHPQRSCSMYSAAPNGLTGYLLNIRRRSSGCRSPGSSTRRILPRSMPSMVCRSRRK